jgi:hypothetical protein
MTTLTEAAIMAMAEDAGIITGENLRRDGPGGSYMLMRSVGEAVNVRSDHLISLVRSALAASEVQAELVGEATPAPGTNGGFTMCVFNGALVPAGTKLYAHPPAPEPVAPFGWAIVCNDGTTSSFRARINNFFGAVMPQEAFEPEDVARRDREWAGLAPHRLVTLYAHPPAPEQPAPALASAPRVPLTDEQRAALKMTLHHFGDDQRVQCLRLLLAAAPQPEGDTP